MTQETQKPADEILREFVRENESLVYNFCLSVSGDESLADRLVLAVFEKFNKTLSKKLKRSSQLDSKNIRLELFKLAASEMRQGQQAHGSWHVNGRDTRAVKYLQLDPRDSKYQGNEDDFFLAMQYRFLLVDADYRYVIVLRDLLGFEDEEVAEILELRWGVFRHRLHRGRMELLNILEFKTNLPGRSEPHRDVLHD